MPLTYKDLWLHQHLEDRRGLFFFSLYERYFWVRMFAERFVQRWDMYEAWMIMAEAKAMLRAYECKKKI